MDVEYACQDVKFLEEKFLPRTIIEMYYQVYTKYTSLSKQNCPTQNFLFSKVLKIKQGTPY